MKSLYEIYREHQGKISDKWSIYLNEYDRFFSSYRDRPVSVLEIGIQNGGSLEIWGKYFLNAKALVGCDINPDCAKLTFDDPRINVVVGDANTDATEAEILTRSPSLDVIIDDGSHTSRDIVQSFARYFRHLSLGGIFVAEDLHCSYWSSFEGGLYYPYSSISFFKRLADVVNHEHWGIEKERKQLLQGFAKHFTTEFAESDLAEVHSIEFFNSVCVVHKRSPQFNVLGERFIAGQEDAVLHGLRGLVGHSLTEPQLSNPWAKMTVAPEEDWERLSKALPERDAQIAERDAQITERDAQITECDAQITERDAQITERDAQITERDAQITELGQEILERDRQIRDILTSHSWRLTQPIRLLGAKVRRLRFHINELLRIVYRRLPLSADQRAILRGWYNRRKGFSAIKAKNLEYIEPSERFSKHTRLAMLEAPIRILLIERSVPKPNQDAGSMMIYSFVRVFREQGHAVSFFPADMAYDPDYTPPLLALGVKCLHAPEVESLYAHLVEAGDAYDIVIVCRPDYADAFLPLLRTHCPHARLLYETHDLHFVREQRQAEFERRPDLLEQARLRKDQEFRIAASVDCTIVVSEQERQVLLNENPDLYVEVIPVVGESFGVGAGFESRQDLLFIGGYEHKPNVDAVLFFVQDIFPLILAEISDVRFHIVGSNPPPEVLALASENIIVHGFVPDITELMRGIRISVNPLRFGAGVKGKIVTSMSYGVPCIGTTIALEGMGVVHGEQALVADTPGEFAVEVLRLYRDSGLWENLAAAGLALASRSFSLEAAARGFHRIFITLLGTAPRNGLYLERITSREAWLQKDRVSEQRLRQAIEMNLIDGGEPFSTRAFCLVCGKEEAMHTDLQHGFPQPDGSLYPNWRERVVCPGCQLNNRMRAAIHLFHLLCAPSPESRLYITEQTTPLFAWFRGAYEHVIGSEFLGGGIPAGELNDAGIRNESLTKLSFEDNLFDAILSFDVMEHIPDFLQAFRECFRCLKPRGALFFTVPFDHNSEQHIVRAEMDEAGQISHLLPPEYHGDPINSDGCLCFYHFGWQLLGQLRALGFRDAAAYSYWSQRFGYLGGSQILFMVIK